MMQRILAPIFLRNISSSRLWHQHNDKRYLFGWLVTVFNNVDEQMIKEHGPQVAAAQWLLRNGSKVKWSKCKDMSEDYTQLLEDESFKKDFIVEIDATGSSINHVGFPYLKNLKELRKIIFDQTEYLEDKALDLLAQYQLPNLKHLEVANCYDITDAGILSLRNLKSLEYLKLQNLSVDNKDACSTSLQEALNKCKIEWN